MTQIYYVRHAEPNYSNHDDVNRELTPKGRADCQRVKAFLMDKGIEAIFSSPYRRAVDTILPFAEAVRLPIQHVYDLRERKVDTVWIDDFTAFSRRQWADFDFHLDGGECLREVQVRNIAALNRILLNYSGKRIVIGGHGTAVSAILNHFDPSFGYGQFESIRSVMPWIVRMDFDGTHFIRWESCTLK